MLNRIVHRIIYNHMRKKDGQKWPVLAMRQIGNPNATAIVGY